MPSPAISRWSSSAALSGVFLSAEKVRQAACRQACCRSARRRGRQASDVRPASSANSMKPKRRGSLNTTRDFSPRGAARWNTTWSCAASLRPLVMELAGIDASSPASIRNDPDMPRWQISSGPPSICGGEVFRPPAERRRSSCPQAVRRILLGKGKRRSGRRVSTRDDARALHDRLQAAPDRLDLGKLRHGRRWS